MEIKSKGHLIMSYANIALASCLSTGSLHSFTVGNYGLGIAANTIGAFNIFAAIGNYHFATGKEKEFHGKIGNIVVKAPKKLGKKYGNFLKTSLKSLIK